jgi:hypothetical protein
MWPFLSADRRQVAPPCSVGGTALPSLRTKLSVRSPLGSRLRGLYATSLRRSGEVALVTSVYSPIDIPTALLARWPGRRRASSASFSMPDAAILRAMRLTVTASISPSIPFAGSSSVSERPRPGRTSVIRGALLLAHVDHLPLGGQKRVLHDAEQRVGAGEVGLGLGRATPELLLVQGDHRIGDVLQEPSVGLLVLLGIGAGVGHDRPCPLPLASKPRKGGGR